MCVCDRPDLSNDDDSLSSQAVQVILALFHCALGALSASLFLEEDINNIGDIPVLLPLGYIVWSSPFVSKPWCFLFQFHLSSNVSSELLMRSRNGLKTQYLTLNSKFHCGNSLIKVESRIWAGVGSVYLGKAFLCLLYV